MAVEAKDVTAVQSEWREAANGAATVYVGLKGSGRALVKALADGVDPASVGGEITVAWNAAGTPTSISYNGLPDGTVVWVRAGQTANQIVSVQSW